MERLLRFAVEHDRVIRLMFMRDGRLFQVNAHIVSYDDKQVSFVTTRSPRTQVISREELLAVDSAAGMMGRWCNPCLLANKQNVRRTAARKGAKDGARGKEVLDIDRRRFVPDSIAAASMDA